MRRDLLDDDALDRIHAQAMRILEDIGTEVHSPAMLERLAVAGQRVDGTRVRWDSGFVMERLGEVPSSVAMRGRDTSTRSLSAVGAWSIHRWVVRPLHPMPSGAAATEQ